jgi:hypothetical protein
MTARDDSNGDITASHIIEWNFPDELPPDR